MNDFATETDDGIDRIVECSACGATGLPERVLPDDEGIVAHDCESFLPASTPRASEADQ